MARRERLLMIVALALLSVAAPAAGSGTGAAQVGTTLPADFHTQCDLAANPTNRSAGAHSTVANIPDLRRFVLAVLDDTGARQVDIVGHSLGVTLARAWLRTDRAFHLVRRFVAIDGPNHGIINCSPSALNFYQLPGQGGFTPDSAICLEYGSPDTPLLRFLNDGDDTPGPTRYLVIRNDDTSFVYFSKQDGIFLSVPAQDREGDPDFLFDDKRH